MRGPRHTLLKRALILAVALALQLSLVADLRLFGAMGDLLLLVTVASALVEGPERGATTGFAAGVLYDLALSTPFGLSPLVYATVGFGVGAVVRLRGRPGRGFSLVVVVAASVAAMVLFWIVGGFVGAPSRFGELPRLAVATSLWGVILVLPVQALFRRISPPVEPDRVLLGFGR